MKNFKLLGCKVLMRELYSLAASCENIIDIKWLEQQLHNTPEILRARLQQEIQEVENENTDYDAILLGYGLCSNGILGLRSTNTPLVVPRGYDCMTLLVGSKEKYQEIFDKYSGGIYWYSPGWIEHCNQPGEDRYKTTYEEYLKKYGEDNAQYLMDMEQNWMVEYKCATYVNWKDLNVDSKYRDYTKECASYLNWEYNQVEGKKTLLEDMLNGVWRNEDFLVVEQGQEIITTNDEKIIGAVIYER